MNIYRNELFILYVISEYKYLNYYKNKIPINWDNEKI
jgi:hypothetical protein